MAGGIEVDFSELNMLAADLTAAGTKVRPFVVKALEVTANNIKDEWRAGAAVTHRGVKNAAPAYQYAIDYDIEENRNDITAEIGPLLGKTKGAGMGFLEEGGGGVRSAPQHAGRDALEANEGDFVKGLEIAAMDALED